MKHCHDGELNKKDIDVKNTSIVYNLCFWIGERSSYIYLPGEPLSVVELTYDGQYRLYSEDCSREDEYVLKLIKALGVNEDQSDLYVRGLGDPLLGSFLNTYRGLRLRSTDLWWALITGTCQQNTSFKQGWTFLHRIVKLYGKIVDLDGKRRILRPPKPREVLKDIDKLIHAGVGYRAKTIKNIAEFIVREEIEDSELERKDPRDIERTLTTIKGVGPYTARLAMTLALRRYELPPIDRWLRKIASAVYEVDESIVEDYWVKKWNKWSGLASIYVTIALDAEYLQKALERVRNRDILPRISKKPSPLNMQAFCLEPSIALLP